MESIISIPSRRFPWAKLITSSFAGVTFGGTAAGITAYGLSNDASQMKSLELNNISLSAKNEELNKKIEEIKEDDYEGLLKEAENLEKESEKKDEQIEELKGMLKAKLTDYCDSVGRDKECIIILNDWASL